MEAYAKRTGRDPTRQFAVGDADTILERVGEYVAGGVQKFILRPAADGDEDMYVQTRRLVEEVLPRMAARWPRAPKNKT